MSGNRIYVQGSYIDVHDNENVYLNVDKAKVSLDEKIMQREDHINSETLTKAVLAVQPYFWGASSYAVIFCVCRDMYHFADNMSSFERRLMSMEELNNSKYPCKKETITSTVRNNPYMRLHVSKWGDNDCMERAILLRDKFIKAVEKSEQE